MCQGGKTTLVAPCAARSRTKPMSVCAGSGVHSAIHREIRSGNVRGLWTGDKRHQRGDLVNVPVAVEGCGGLLRYRPLARAGIQFRVDRTRLHVVARSISSSVESLCCLNSPSAAKSRRSRAPFPSIRLGNGCATARRGAGVALPKTDRGNSRFLGEVESLVSYWELRTREITLRISFFASAVSCRRGSARPGNGARARRWGRSQSR
jgi:hypothetical protein